MIGVLVRRRKFGRRHTEGRQPCEDGGRNWRDAAANQGVPRTASHHQKLEEARRILLWNFQKECGPAVTLILDFWLPEL